MNSELSAPWDLEDSFPKKLNGHDFGYLKGRKLVGCSKDDLINRCSKLDLPEISLVWYPEVERLVPVSTVQFLQDALKTRLKAKLKQDAKVSAFNLFTFGLITFFSRGTLGYFFFMLCLTAVIGVWPLVRSLRLLRNYKEIDWELRQEEIPVYRYSTWVETRSLVVTWIILAALFLVLISQLVMDLPRSIGVAGLVKPSVWKGEWWRLCTGPLMHGNVLHFVFNATALIGFGRLTEVLTSRYHLAMVFGISAIGGSLFSLFLLPNTDSVGASGGLLGLIGFLIILGHRRKTMLPPGFAKSFAINIGIIAAMGLVAYDIIDNAAHLGGFVSGAVVGLLVINRNGILPLECSRQIKVCGVLSTCAVIGFSLCSIGKILGKF